MAVQKKHVTRSKRGMRRAHDALTGPTLTIDKQTGEKHRRHHISPTGQYRGRQVLKDPTIDSEDEE